MADYIDKNILCEAYIHLEPEDWLTKSQDQYLEELEAFATKRGKFFLYSDIELNLRHKEGTLTVYVTVLGTIGALYKGVGEYPKFREGAVAIYDDVKRFAETVITEGLFGAKARRNQIVRLEARTGVVGSLRHIVSLLDSVQREDGTNGVRGMIRRLQTAEEASRDLISNLNSVEDREFIRVGLKQLAGQLPAAPSPHKRKENDPKQVQQYKDARASLIASLEPAHVKELPLNR
jgi:hypothetical protein